MAKTTVDTGVVIKKANVLFNSGVEKVYPLGVNAENIYLKDDGNGDNGIWGATAQDYFKMEDEGEAPVNLYDALINGTNHHRKLEGEFNNYIENQANIDQNQNERIDENNREITYLEGIINRQQINIVGSSGYENKNSHLILQGSIDEELTDDLKNGTKKEFPVVSIGEAHNVVIENQNDRDNYCKARTYGRNLSISINEGNLNTVGNVEFTDDNSTKIILDTFSLDIDNKTEMVPTTTTTQKITNTSVHKDGRFEDVWATPFLLDKIGSIEKISDDINYNLTIYFKQESDLKVMAYIKNYSCLDDIKNIEFPTSSLTFPFSGVKVSVEGAGARLIFTRNEKFPLDTLSSEYLIQLILVKKEIQYTSNKNVYEGSFSKNILLNENYGGKLSLSIDSANENASYLQFDKIYLLKPENYYIDEEGNSSIPPVGDFQINETFVLI